MRYYSVDELQAKLPTLLSNDTKPVKKEFVLKGINVTIFVQFFMN